MPTKTKAQRLLSTAQFTATCDEAAALQLDIETRVAALNERLSAIEVPEKAVIENLKEQLNSKMVLLETFAEENVDTLLPGDKKSGETAKATYGFHLTPAALKPLNKGWNQTRSIVALEEAGEVRMLRQKTELDKDAIKAVWANEPDKLKEFGFRLEQRDEFWFEPKRAVEATLTA